MPRLKRARQSKQSHAEASGAEGDGDISAYASETLSGTLAIVSIGDEAQSPHIYPDVDNARVDDVPSLSPDRPGLWSRATRFVMGGVSFQNEDDDDTVGDPEPCVASALALERLRLTSRAYAALPQQECAVES